MTEREIVDNKAFKIGWSLDVDHGMPRIAFRKVERTSDSVCFIYDGCDVKAHFERHCITNLEYVEGQEFYNQSGLQELRIKEINKHA